MTVRPRVDQTAEEDQALADRLKAYKETLSQEELEELARRTKELKEYQDTPSSQEDLREDPHAFQRRYCPAGRRILLLDKEEKGIPVIHSSFFTAGIGYLKLCSGQMFFRRKIFPMQGF